MLSSTPKVVIWVYRLAATQAEYSSLNNFFSFSTFRYLELITNRRQKRREKEIAGKCPALASKSTHENIW